MANSEPIADKLVRLGADPGLVDIDGKVAHNSPTLPGGRAEAVPPLELSVAIVGPPKEQMAHSIAEAIILACTLNESTPRPEKGVTGGDPLRPERFSWSQRRLEGSEQGAPGEIPIIWKTSPTDRGLHLCIRIGLLDWFKLKKVRYSFSLHLLGEEIFHT